MVRGFLIIWILHIACALTAFIAGASRKKRMQGEVEELPSNIPRQLYIWLSIVVIYLIIRFTTGWRITGWYGEAIVVLLIFAYFDYCIIYKYRAALSEKVKSLYLVTRVSFFLSMIGRLLSAFFMVLLLAPITAEYLLPLDRSLGEKHIYGKIYFYKNDREWGYMFKKKVFLFEKDLVLVGGNTLDLSGNDPITGYVTKRGDKIFIHGSGYGGYFSDFLIVTILPEKKLKIESVHDYWDESIKSSVVKKDLHAIINY